MFTISDAQLAKGGLKLCKLCDICFKKEQEKIEKMFQEEDTWNQIEKNIGIIQIENNYLRNERSKSV
jgi:hypothetical protein